MISGLQVIIELVIVLQGCQVVESRTRAAEETGGGEEKETGDEEGGIVETLFGGPQIHGADQKHGGEHGRCTQTR